MANKIIYTFHSGALVYNRRSVFHSFYYTRNENQKDINRFVSDKNQYFRASLDSSKVSPEIWIYEGGLRSIVSAFGFNYETWLESAQFTFIENQLESFNYKKRVIWRSLSDYQYNYVSAIANRANHKQKSVRFNSYMVNLVIQELIKEGYPIGIRMDKRQNKTFIKIL